MDFRERIYVCKTMDKRERAETQGGMDSASEDRSDIGFHDGNGFMALPATLVTAFVTFEEPAPGWKDAVTGAFVGEGWNADPVALVFSTSYEGPTSTPEFYEALVDTVASDISTAIDRAERETGESLCANVNFQVGNFGSYTVHACNESSDAGMVQEIFLNFHLPDED